MKIKKHTESVFDALKSVADRKGNILNTFISLDTAGNMIIDGAVGHINYSDMKISVDVSGKSIYIYGKGMKVLSCSGDGIFIAGQIEKIELYEVE